MEGGSDCCPAHHLGHKPRPHARLHLHMPGRLRFRFIRLREGAVCALHLHVDRVAGTPVQDPLFSTRPAPRTLQVVDTPRLSRLVQILMTEALLVYRAPLFTPTTPRCLPRLLAPQAVSGFKHSVRSLRTGTDCCKQSRAPLCRPNGPHATQTSWRPRSPVYLPQGHQDGARAPADACRGLHSTGRRVCAHVQRQQQQQALLERACLDRRRRHRPLLPAVPARCALRHLRDACVRVCSWPPGPLHLRAGRLLTRLSCVWRKRALANLAFVRSPVHITPSDLAPMHIAPTQQAHSCLAPGRQPSAHLAPAHLALEQEARALLALALSAPAHSAPVHTHYSSVHRLRN